MIWEHHRPHVPLALDPADEFQDLRLDRHVERRRRLVGDQQIGPSVISAIAIITRCRMPPENSCGSGGGSRSSSDWIPTASSVFTARAQRLRDATAAVVDPQRLDQLRSRCG